MFSILLALFHAAHQRRSLFGNLQFRLADINRLRYYCASPSLALHLLHVSRNRSGFFVD